MPKSQERKNKSLNKATPREIAYLALVAAKKDNRFIHEVLDEWRQAAEPSSRDTALAREIAYGTCRMALALDSLAAQCTTTGKLAIKAKERILLQMALYQHFYMERIPLYAIVNETVSIAQEHCHPNFIKFLNATLRKLEHFTPRLPQGDSAEELSIRYSYPVYYVDMLIKAYGQKDACDILETSNKPAKTVVRLRAPNALNGWGSDSYQLVENSEGRSAIINDLGNLSLAASSPHLYIQNATPTALMYTLGEGASKPLSILDLCASPGGKLLLAHDLFPQAKLTANDVSEVKLKRLKENCDKYSLDVTLYNGPGEQFPSDQRFDLIIMDVPCSNSGVLNKRPEARWRIDDSAMNDTVQLQKRLLAHATSLLNKGGEIWYITCSILPAENEDVIKYASEQLALHPRTVKTILPTISGWDGGFACALTTT